MSDVKLAIKTRITIRPEGDPDNHGFGRGVEVLLMGVDRYGSLNHAAKSLGMAYSKAWNLIRTVEEKLHMRLIDRDGAHGSTLTAEGREFLQHYQEMVRAANDAAQAVFAKYFQYSPRCSRTDPDKL